MIPKMPKPKQPKRKEPKPQKFGLVGPTVTRGPDTRTPAFDRWLTRGKV